jgi:hypothetical protein
MQPVSKRLVSAYIAFIIIAIAVLADGVFPARFLDRNSELEFWLVAFGAWMVAGAVIIEDVIRNPWKRDRL